MLKQIDHIAVVVQDLDAALGVYRDALGLPLMRVEDVSSEGVKAAFLALPEGAGEVELVQPTDGESGIGRYLAARGEGLHHICFRVDNIEAVVAHVTACGMQVVEPEPCVGGEGRKYVFIHPKAACGVLVELYEMPER